MTKKRKTQVARRCFARQRLLEAMSSEDSEKLEDAIQDAEFVGLAGAELEIASKTLEVLNRPVMVVTLHVMPQNRVGLGCGFEVQCTSMSGSELAKLKIRRHHRIGSIRTALAERLGMPELSLRLVISDGRLLGMADWAAPAAHLLSSQQSPSTMSCCFPWLTWHVASGVTEAGSILRLFKGPLGLE
mmetsp:Transcript_82261/g.142939  ORF Transcript_82261/g.142939 Transcript_82261/m.142939 type:complete len:187 (-) Transcript_82261:124-684(-)